LISFVGLDNSTWVVVAQDKTGRLLISDPGMNALRQMDNEKKPRQTAQKILIRAQLLNFVDREITTLPA
jgi:hypothetical protein